MNTRNIAYVIAAAAVAAAFAGCGGGGGGSSSSTSSPTGTNLSTLPTNSFQYSSTQPLSPPDGLSTGSNSVIITGSGQLTQPVSVYFGSTQATNVAVVSNSSTNTVVSATAPAGSGTVDVRVVDAKGVSAISTYDQYQYVPPLPTPPGS